MAKTKKKSLSKKNKKKTMKGGGTTGTGHDYRTSKPTKPIYSNPKELITMTEIQDKLKNMEAEISQLVKEGEDKRKGEPKRQAVIKGKIARKKEAEAEAEAEAKAKAEARRRTYLKNVSSLDVKREQKQEQQEQDQQKRMKKNAFFDLKRREKKKKIIFDDRTTALKAFENNSDANVFLITSSTDNTDLVFMLRNNQKLKEIEIFLIVDKQLNIQYRTKVKSGETTINVQTDTLDKMIKELLILEFHMGTVSQIKTDNTVETYNISGNKVTKVTALRGGSRKTRKKKVKR